MLIHNALITGSLSVNGTGYNTGSFSGSFTGAVAGTTATASYVEYNNVANKPALVSGSSQITYSGLTGIPSDIVSGSSQVTYSGLTGIPAGIVSGSAQVAGFGIFATTGSNQFNGSQVITGSLTVTGQVVAQTLNVQQVTSSIVFSSGSNVFGNSLSNTQQFTGSVSMTGSLTTTTVQIAAAGSANPTIFRNVSGTTSSTSNTNVIGFNNVNNIFVSTQNSGGFILGFNNSVSNREYTLPDASGTVALTSNLSSYLPLTGGTLTGALNGTSAVFATSSILTSAMATPQLRLINNATATINQRVDLGLRFEDGTFNGIGGISMIRESATARNGTIVIQPINSSGDPLAALSIASTGAATFSSSVTAIGTLTGGGTNYLVNTSTGTNPVYQRILTTGGDVIFGIASSTGTSLLPGVGNYATVLYNNTNTDISFGTNQLLRMTITSGGNVGIGASSIQSKLTIYDGDIRLYKPHVIAGGDSWKANINFTDEIDRLGARIVGERTAWDGAPMGLGFDTGALNSVTRRMTITSDGYVWINGSISGMSGSSANLQVNGFVRTGGQIILHNAANAAQAVSISCNGADSFNIAGALSKSSGTFKIDHPLESKKDTHHLVHSFIEGPRVDLIYRDKVTLVNGAAQVNIDEISNMTEGTFEALCREVQCFTTNETGWDLVKGKVIGNIIYIESQNTNSTDEISWMIVGERKDKHIMDTSWTDNNGKIIVEPLKQIITPENI